MNYGQHTAVLPATGMTAGLGLYAAAGLGAVTVGIILMTIYGIARRRKHPRP